MFRTLLRAIRGRAEPEVAATPAEPSPGQASVPAGDDIEVGYYYLARLREGTFWQRLVARARLAAIFERGEQLEEAAECYEAIILAGVRSPDLYERLAVVYRRLGRHDVADQVLAALDSPEPGAWTARARSPSANRDETIDDDIARLSQSLQRLAQPRRAARARRRQVRDSANRAFGEWMEQQREEQSTGTAPAGGDGRVRAKEPWSDAEDRYIMEHADRPAREVAAALGRSVQSIYRRRSELRSGGGNPPSASYHVFALVSDDRSEHPARVGAGGSQR